MITVVIASYRYGHLASHCIESLLSQTSSPAKILFVDDGGLDCAHLPALYPDLEYILRPMNLGTVDNFQDMLARVTTEYVLFIGADNWLRSDAIELLSDASTDIVTYDIVVTGKIGYKKRYKNGRHPQEDWNLWDKMLEQGATVASLQEGLLFYRRHRENFLKYETE